MRGYERFAAGVAVSTGLLLLSTSAMAGGFSIREQSTTGLGMAFAGSAAGTDLSSMYWNPAAVTTQDGFNTASSYTLIVPDTAVDVTNNTFGSGGTDIGTLGFLGSSYANYQINKDLYVGLSLNAPFGLTTEADDRGWGGATYNRKSEIVTINAAPTIGYKILPNLSVAAGVQIEYIKVRLASAVPNAFLFDNDIVIKGDDIAAGFTAGMLFEPATGTKIGLGYRSSIKHKLEGEVRGHPLGYNGDATAKLDTPDMVTVSVSQQVTPGFSLMANYEWSNWSNLKQLQVNTATGAITEDYHWKDSWFASVGAEMKLTNSLTGRAGVGYEKSPVPDLTRSARLPDSDRTWLSVGASYMWSEATQIDFGYSHIFFDDATIFQTSKGLLDADVTNSADIVSAGMRMKW